MNGMTLAQSITALLDSIPLVERPQNECCLNDSWWCVDEQPRIRPSSAEAGVGRPEVSA